MAKLKCVTHNRRVHVWDNGQGTLTVHREDGTHCVVNPLVKIDRRNFTPTEVVEWGTLRPGC